MPLIGALVAIGIIWWATQGIALAIAANPIPSTLIIFSILAAIVYYGSRFNAILKRKIEEKKLSEAKYKESRRKQNAELAARKKALATEWEKITREVVKKHAYALAQEKKKYTNVDAYGKVDYSEWEETGLKYFREKVLSEDSAFNGKFQGGAEAFAFPLPGSALQAKKWENFCDNLIEQEINRIASKNMHNATDVNGMNGMEYEDHCKSILENTGWKACLTKSTGDQGVDLIASRNDKRVCIQCKCYSSPVGNSAVQEVTAGKLHWHGTHAVVVSNAGFTKSAQALARSTGVLLMSHEELVDLENRL